MQNFKLLFLATLTVVIFGCAHGQRNYDKLRQEATDCTVGEGRPDHDGCNWCECVEKGVMICSRKKCGWKPDQTLSARPPPKHKSAISKTSQNSPKWKQFFDEAASCSVGEGRKDPDGCNWCDCVAPGVMICSRKKCGMNTDETLSARPSSSPYQNNEYSQTSADLQRWKQFSDDAASCKEGDRTQDPDGCNMCECIENGVMICSRKLCRPTTNQLVSKRFPNKRGDLQSLKKFAEDSADCTVGERRKDPDGCNWCQCVATGVMICSRKKCLPTSAKAPQSRLALKQDSAVIITSGKPNMYRKKLQDFYNREKASDCVPDGKNINLPCHVCKCVQLGVMKCTSVEGSICGAKDTKLYKNPKLKLDLPADSDYLAYY